MPTITCTHLVSFVNYYLNMLTTGVAKVTKNELLPDQIIKAENADMVKELLSCCFFRVCALLSVFFKFC